MVRSAAAESTGLHYYDETPAGQQDAGDRERDLLIASIDELSPDHPVTSPRSSNRSVTGIPPLISRAYGATPVGVTSAVSLHRPARGHPELFGEFLIGILRQDQAGDPQDRPGVLAGRRSTQTVSSALLCVTTSRS